MWLCGYVVKFQKHKYQSSENVLYYLILSIKKPNASNSNIIKSLKTRNVRFRKFNNVGAHILKAGGYVGCCAVGWAARNWAGVSWGWGKLGSVCFDLWNSNQRYLGTRQTRDLVSLFTIQMADRIIRRLSADLSDRHACETTWCKPPPAKNDGNQAPPPKKTI